MKIESFEQLSEEINKLITSWQSRDEQEPLKTIRSGWPLLTGLTDDYARLLNALERIRDTLGNQLTQEEANVLTDLITAVDKAVYRR